LIKHYEDDTMSYKGKHFITTQEWTKEELEHVLDVAVDLKAQRARGEQHRILLSQTLFMIFFESSLRTRNSFEAGMTQLGGHAHDLSPQNLWIHGGETPEDNARVLSRYGEAIAVRACEFGKGNKFIRDMAAASTVPILNMQCDVYHPCQAMADLMVLKEKLGDLKGKKIGVSWAYAPARAKPMSVAQSLVQLLPRFGMDVVLARPPEFRLRDDIMDQGFANAKEGGGSITVTEDFDDAFDGVDVVYPKSFGCLLTTTDGDKALEICKKYPDWKATKEKMDLTKNGKGLYMHCLPANRNQEVTDEVIDGPNSIVFDEAENRMHVQKALLALTMGGLE